MVDMELLLKDAAEIGGNALIFAEAFGYVVRSVFYPSVKSSLEKLVYSGEMKREEADDHLRTYRTYMLLPWPIGGLYVIGKIKQYDKERQKGGST